MVPIFVVERRQLLYDSYNIIANTSSQFNTVPSVFQANTRKKNTLSFPTSFLNGRGLPYSSEPKNYPLVISCLHLDSPVYCGLHFCMRKHEFLCDIYCLGMLSSKSLQEIKPLTNVLQCAHIVSLNLFPF